MSTTSRLSLPYIASQQAQKQVTYNAAMELLDALVQLSVASRSTVTPPPGPAEGDIYLVPAAATAAWSERTGLLAVWRNGGWTFITPQPGWIAYVRDTASQVVFDGTAWVALIATGPALEQFGIHTAADLTNRLAVASAASLFTHDGAGHQMKINKALPADTASLLFQTNWSGRAEIGLAGDDALHVKVSPDGAAWLEALAVAPTGQVSLPAGQLVFPATPNPSPSPTTLDDYREGSWTPTLTFGGQSVGMVVANAVGRYTRIGRSVTLYGALALSGRGTSTGAASIGNLPFVSGPDLPGGAMIMAVATGMTGIVGGISGVIGTGKSTIALYATNGGNALTISNANFTSTATIQFAAIYDV